MSPNVLQLFEKYILEEEEKYDGTNTGLKRGHKVLNRLNNFGYIRDPASSEKLAKLYRLFILLEFIEKTYLLNSQFSNDQYSPLNIINKLEFNMDNLYIKRELYDEYENVCVSEIEKYNEKLKSAEDKTKYKKNNKKPELYNFMEHFYLENKDFVNGMQKMNHSKFGNSKVIEPIVKF